jgi:hypothetical protein
MKSGQLNNSWIDYANLLWTKKTVYNSETSKVMGAQLRYVIYAYATSESTGLPEILMASNHPWMEPGTHRAHIMISPLTEDKE